MTFLQKTVLCTFSAHKPRGVFVEKQNQWQANHHYQKRANVRIHVQGVRQDWNHHFVETQYSYGSSGEFQDYAWRVVLYFLYQPEEGYAADDGDCEE